MNKLIGIIVTHNSENAIASCIESLQDQSIPVIVVDSASNDRTSDVVSGMSVESFARVENKGFAAAANYGLQLADRAQYYLFLNPDARMSGSLSEAIRFLDTNTEVGVIGLGLCGQDGVLEIDAAGNEPTLFSLFVRKLTQRPTAGGVQYLDWVSGGAMIVRAEVFTQIKGFDERFFLYWEDVDFCRQARGHGWKVVYLPKIKVLHGRGGSLSDLKAKTKVYDISADRYFQKHYASPIWFFQRFLRHIYRLVSPLVR